MLKHINNNYIFIIGKLNIREKCKHGGDEISEKKNCPYMSQNLMNFESYRFGGKMVTPFLFHKGHLSPKCIFQKLFPEKGRLDYPQSCCNLPSLMWKMKS